MAKLTRPPPATPVKTLNTNRPPPVSRTRDDFTHHTSPNQGPQPQAPEVVTAQQPRAKLTKLPDVPMHTTKHPNPVGRPRNTNDA